jgi:hypothetical protein
MLWLAEPTTFYIVAVLTVALALAGTWAPAPACLC